MHVTVTVQANDKKEAVNRTGTNKYSLIPRSPPKPLQPLEWFGNEAKHTCKQKPHLSGNTIAGPTQILSCRHAVR